MKVLHLISGGDTGGAKTHIISLLKELKNYADTKLVCFINDTFYADAKAEGINIEVMEQKRRSDMTIVKKLVDEINKGEYDILHCHGARANFVAYFLKKHIDIPMITTVHSDYLLDFKDSFYKNMIFTPLNKMALKKFDYYIAVTNSFKEMLVERGFKRDKIETVYNGIDMSAEVNYVPRDEFYKRYNIDPSNKFVTGIAARLDKVKNHEMLIKAANEAIKINPELLFLIAGLGDEETNLKSMCNEYGIEDNVKFLGFVNDPYSFFNAIDVNTLTSVSESFPYVILEAAKMKTPTISTRVGGIYEVIEDGENGYLVNSDDYKELSERILNLAADREKLNEFGEKIYEKVRDNFSTKNMAEDQYNIYMDILNKWR
ncbi:MAG: glycosyltransferase family 4 protein [Tissierellia bacterium]|nr:glycosyltransferase family 4 protein [Tissierellia bacterium]